MPLHVPASRQEMIALLSGALPAPRLSLLKEIAGEAAGQGLPLYAVGGFVRDLLLGCPATDFDLVVEGDAIVLARALALRYGGKVTIHTRFRTAQWHIPESLAVDSEPPSPRDPRHSTLDSRLSPLDLISARSETYAHPGALPTVKPGSLADDLRRRDFTINTLALRLDGEAFGELRDDLGGLEDLRGGRVRVLHPGSYRDDPTRILRAARYEQRYRFRIAAEDLDRIVEAGSLLGKLSGERLRHELDLTLAEREPAAVLSRLAGLGVLGELHPSLKWDPSSARLLQTLADSEPDSWRGVPDLPRVPRRSALGYLLWLGGLPAREIEVLAARLSLTASLREALLAASALLHDLPSLAGARPSAVAARLEDVPLLAVCAVERMAAGPAQASLENYLARWRHIRAKTTGHDLNRRGLSPGPVYERILRRLRDARLDGEIGTDEEERGLLDRLIRDI